MSVGLYAVSGATTISGLMENGGLIVKSYKSVRCIWCFLPKCAYIDIVLHGVERQCRSVNDAALYVTENS